MSGANTLSLRVRVVSPTAIARYLWMVAHLSIGLSYSNNPASFRVFVLRKCGLFCTLQVISEQNINFASSNIAGKRGSDNKNGEKRVINEEGYNLR